MREKKVFKCIKNEINNACVITKKAKNKGSTYDKDKEKINCLPPPSTIPSTPNLNKKSGTSAIIAKIS